MHSSRRSELSPAAAVLWASAFIIAALVIVQAGRLQSNPVHADMVQDRGDYTLMTTRSGREENTVLYVMDGRTQTLLVYEVEDARRGQLFLRDGGSLDVLFRAARR